MTCSPGSLATACSSSPPRVCRCRSTTWADMLPFHQDGALGRDWQDAAQTLVSKESGMMLLGTFIGQQFTNKADYDDLDFFPYPQVDAQWGQDSIDAPIDGFMLSKS